MYRILVIVLLVLLPLQFSWAAVATYCGHEEPVGAAHFGHHAHHTHQQQADTGGHAEPVADLHANADAAGDKAAGALDLDCGHCHGTCSAMLSLPSALPGALSTGHPSATVEASGSAHAPTRPERPQWLPLA